MPAASRLSSGPSLVDARDDRSAAQQQALKISRSNGSFVDRPFLLHGHKKVHGHGEEEEDLFVFNDTIEGPRAPAVKPGRVTQA